MMPACTGPTGIWCRRSPRPAETRRRRGGRRRPRGCRAAARRPIGHGRARAAVGEASGSRPYRSRMARSRRSAGGMQSADRRKAPCRAGKAEDGDAHSPPGRHMHRIAVAPQAEHGAAARRPRARRPQPGRSSTMTRGDGPRLPATGAMMLARHRHLPLHPSSRATFWNQATSGAGR